jgi:hypothetical protein
MSTFAKVVLVLLGIWILLGVVGFLIKGLFFLFVIACIAVAVTAVGGARRRRMITRR